MARPLKHPQNCPMLLARFALTAAKIWTNYIAVATKPSGKGNFA
jgi:hypothetical protein